MPRRDDWRTEALFFVGFLVCLALVLAEMHGYIP